MSNWKRLYRVEGQMNLVKLGTTEKVSQNGVYLPFLRAATAYYARCALETVLSQQQFELCQSPLLKFVELTATETEAAENDPMVGIVAATKDSFPVVEREPLKVQPYKAP